jgi:SPP1 family predicted phage head-tail adaptor
MITPVGKLRSLITIQQRSSGKSASGQPVNTWTTFKQVYARLRSVTGSENFKGEQYSPEVTHEVTLRFVDGITPMMRVLTPDGKILDIKSANYGERKLDDVVLTCVERISKSGDLDVG